MSDDISRSALSVVDSLGGGTISSRRFPKECLLSSVNLLEVVCRAVPDALVVFGSDGKFCIASSVGHGWLEELGADLATLALEDLLEVNGQDLEGLTMASDSPRVKVEVRGEHRGAAFLSHMSQGDATFFILTKNDSRASDEAEEKIASLARFPSENPNPVLRVMPNGEVLYENTAASMFVATSDPPMVPDSWLAHLAAVHSANEAHTFMITPDHRTFALSVAPVPGFPYLNIYGRDETDRLAAEARVHQSLEEKTLLLEEIHHRVKNNLQIVIGMLSLQREHLRSREAVSVMEQTANRIRVMANLHQKIYEHDDLTNIDLSDYLSETLMQIHDFFRHTHPDVRLVCDIDAGSAGIEQALLVGQLLNELMTNSLKHAFPHGRAGCIEVRVELCELGRVQFIGYQDDGVGMASVRSEGLGSRLIELLARQLKLRAEKVQRAVGTRYEFGRLRQRLPSSPRGPGAVLMVEDELLIAESRKLALLGEGITHCHVVASAEEALSFLEDVSEPPVVVVTDINLGDGLNGLELVGRLEKMLPRCKFLVVSGYTRAQYERQLEQLRSEVVWLDKNVTNATLAEAVRKCLPPQKEIP